MDKISRIIASVLLSRWTFIVFSIVLIGYNVIGMHLLYSRFGSDFWEHLAAMHSFARNPMNPPNPYILSAEPTHLFTPYHLFWGVIARILSIHVFWLLPVVAGINMLLFVASTHEFSRIILRDEKFALAIALTMLFYWNDPWSWSGFYNFGLLALTAVYPYWFALPVSLLVIARYGESDRLILNILYGLAVCCVFLSHPLTGSFLILSLGVKLLLMKSDPVLKRLELLIIPLLSIVLSALFWPYFPVVSTVLGSGAFAEVGFAGNWELFYENAAWRILPALFGLPFLVHLLLKRQFTYVPVGLVATASIYFLNYAVLHNSTLARYVIYIAFFCQVGIVLILKQLEKHVLYKYAVFGFLLGTLFFAVPQLESSAKRIGPVRDIFHGKPIGTYSNVTAFRQYSALGTYIGNSDVVMAPLGVSWELPGVIGCRVVGVAHSNPFMPDYLERKMATENFFTEDISEADRLAIISNYNVDYVLVPKAYAASFADLPAYLRLEYKNQEYALYTVESKHG